MPVDTITSGPSREPRRWRRGRQPRPGWPRRRPWPAIPAVAAVAVAAVVLVTTGGHVRHVVSAPLLAALPLQPLLGGVPAQGRTTGGGAVESALWQMTGG
jgi:hypothetical protein